MARNYVYRDPRIERFEVPGIHDVHVDAALSNISIAYRNGTYIAEKVFPVVKVNKQSDKYFIFSKAHWFRDEAGVRAPGARASRVNYSLETALYASIEYAAAKSVPDEIVLNADVPLSPITEATEFVTDKILLRLEKDVADLVTTSSNWTNTGTPTTVWDNDTSDPVNDVVGDGKIQETVRQAIGRYANTAVLGAQVWAALKRHPDILDRVKYTQLGVVTQALVAQLFEVETLLVGTSIINTAQEGAPNSFSDVWGNFAWFGYVPPAAGLMTPAAGYIFAWKERQVNRYREDQEHADVIEALFNWDSKVTSADSGYLLTNVTS